MFLKLIVEDFKGLGEDFLLSVGTFNCIFSFTTKNIEMSIECDMFFLLLIQIINYYHFYFSEGQLKDLPMLQFCLMYFLSYNSI